MTDEALQEISKLADVINNALERAGYRLRFKVEVVAEAKAKAYETLDPQDECGRCFRYRFRHHMPIGDLARGSACPEFVEVNRK